MNEPLVLHDINDVAPCLDCIFSLKVFGSQISNWATINNEVKNSSVLSESHFFWRIMILLQSNDVFESFKDVTWLLLLRSLVHCLILCSIKTWLINFDLSILFFFLLMRNLQIYSWSFWITLNYLKIVVKSFIFLFLHIIKVFHGRIRSINSLFMHSFNWAAQFEYSLNLLFYELLRMTLFMLKNGV